MKLENFKKFNYSCTKKISVYINEMRYGVYRGVSLSSLKEIYSSEFYKFV
jgi:hypothetical protein